MDIEKYNQVKAQIEGVFKDTGVSGYDIHLYRQGLEIRVYDTVFLYSGKDLEKSAEEIIRKFWDEVGMKLNDLEVYAAACAESVRIGRIMKADGSPKTFKEQRPALEKMMDDYPEPFTAGLLARCILSSIEAETDPKKILPEIGRLQNLFEQFPTDLTARMYRNGLLSVSPDAVLPRHFEKTCSAMKQVVKEEDNVETAADYSIFLALSIIQNPEWNQSSSTAEEMKRIFHQYPCPETAHQYAVSLSNRMIYAPDEQRLLDVLQEIKGVQEQFQLEEIMKIYLHSINVVQMAGIDPVRKEELDREIQLLLQRHPSAEMKGIYGFCLCRWMVEDDDQTENQKRLDEIRSIFEQDPSEQTALPYMIAIGVILGQGVSMEDRKSLIEILSRIVDQYPTQEIYQANMQALSNIKSEDENEETPIRFDA